MMPSQTTNRSPASVGQTSEQPARNTVASRGHNPSMVTPWYDLIEKRSYITQTHNPSATPGSGVTMARYGVAKCLAALIVGNHMQVRMTNAALRGQRVGKRRHIFDCTAQHGNFEAGFAV